MDSEITSGIKIVPFLPPSPPPIESNLIQNDDEFGEVCDCDDMFDITGLSQKLNICEENAKSSKLYSFNNDNEKVDTETQQGTFNKFRLRGEHVLENKDDISIPNIEFLGGAIESIESLYEESKLFPSTSPPPLNCIALPIQEDSYLMNKHNFAEVMNNNIIIEDKVHNPGEQKLPMKFSQLQSEPDIPSMRLKDMSAEKNVKSDEDKITECSQSTCKLGNKEKLTSKRADIINESILNVDIPSNKSFLQEACVDEDSGPEISKILQKIGIEKRLSDNVPSGNSEIGDANASPHSEKDTEHCIKEISSCNHLSSKPNLEANEKMNVEVFHVENKIPLTSLTNLKDGDENVEENVCSLKFSSNSDTKVPSEGTPFTEREFAEFKSITRPSAAESSDVKEKGSHEVSDPNNCHTAGCVCQLKPDTTNCSSEEEFGDFIYNEHFTSKFQSKSSNETSENDDDVNDGSNDLKSVSEPKHDFEQSDDDFGDFVSNDNFTDDGEIKDNYISNEFCPSTSFSPLPQTKPETKNDKEVFVELNITDSSMSRLQLDTDSIKYEKTIPVHKDDNLHDAPVESDLQENSEDESRNFSSSPSIAVASDCRDFSGDRDGEGNSGLAASNDGEDDEEEEFGEFNCPETSTGLHLEFSDDDDDFSSRRFLDTDQKVILQGSLNESGATDNKIRSLMVRWIPAVDLDSSTVNASNINVVKLSEVIEGDAFIWHHLEDIDSSFALKLSWPNSHINKLFLSSLNVDARNILFGHKWSSTIPVFAQTLSFSPLTPAKPSAKSKPWTLDENLSLDSSPSIKISEGEKRASPNTNESKDVTEQKVIPPAQFDWSSSGLTNPLDASGLEKEILDTFSPDVTASAESGVKPRPSSTPLLEKILRESGCGPTQNTELSSLPREVRTVVQSLPDLNFMRSKVLMFPLREGF